MKGFIILFSIVLLAGCNSRIKKTDQLGISYDTVTNQQCWEDRSSLEFLTFHANNPLGWLQGQIEMPICGDLKKGGVVQVEAEQTYPSDPRDSYNEMDRLASLDYVFCQKHPLGAVRHVPSQMQSPSDIGYVKNVVTPALPGQVLACGLLTSTVESACSLKSVGRYSGEYLNCDEINRLKRLRQESDPREKWALNAYTSCYLHPNVGIQGPDRQSLGCGYVKPIIEVACQWPTEHIFCPEVLRLEGLEKNVEVTAYATQMPLQDRTVVGRAWELILRKNDLLFRRTSAEDDKTGELVPVPDVVMTLKEWLAKSQSLVYVNGEYKNLPPEQKGLVQSYCQQGLQIYQVTETDNHPVSVCGK